MKKEDFPRFNDLVNAVHELRQINPPSVTALQLSFKALARYPLHQIEAGFELMLTDGAETYRVPVQPAHIIAAMEKHVANNDGRPSAAEAWNLALQANDESVTLRLTSEVLVAMSACNELIGARDKFAARQAFTAAYEREVSKARRELRLPVWTVSLGTSKAQREEAVINMTNAGLLPAPQATLLIGHDGQQDDGYDPNLARANLAKIKGMLAGCGPAGRRVREQRAQAERDRDAALRAEHDRKVAQAQEKAA